MEKDNIVIHTDGGSRGNPGAAACGFVVDIGENEIYRGSKFLDKQTNNYAEYSGVIVALEWVLSSIPFVYKQLPITFYLDSELVVKQINGLYKVKDLNLQILHQKVLNLVRQLKVKVFFKNVRREQNKIADLLVNQELDTNH